MYCVIQEIQNKKVSHRPTSKRIEVNSYTVKVGDQESYIQYCYSRSSEKFDRPVKTAYKISIHKSYRESGTVKKKQTSICTMGFYDLLESWPGDFLNTAALKKKLEELGISEEALWDLVYVKLNPLIQKVTAEFKKTEEYAAKQEQKKILEEYQGNKKAFESKYGDSTYDRCYDVFGELRNKAYLEELEKNYEAQEQYKSSYQDYKHSNYDWSSFTGASAIVYTEEEKGLIEEIVSLGFKAAAKKYHPDVNPDLENATERFQRLNNVKDKLLRTM